MTDLPKHPLLDRLKQIPVDMRAYVEKRLELVSLETGEKIANIFAKTASTVATTLIVLMALLFFFCWQRAFPWATCWTAMRWVSG